MTESKEEFLRLMGLRGTIEILGHLNEHGSGQYKDFTGFADVPVLNKRLRQLLEYDLITHHLEKKEMRREWYEITDKGKKVLQILEEIVRVVEDEETISSADVHRSIENSGDVPK